MSETLTETLTETSTETPAEELTETLTGDPTERPIETGAEHPAADPAAEPDPAEAAVLAFAEQLTGMLAGATTLLTIELGRRFGLYRALHEQGALTPPRLAVVAGIAPRYAREWLEQQAAAGILSAGAADDPDERRFSLPDVHVPGLVQETHPAHVARIAELFAGVARTFPAVSDDFRAGRGIPFEAYGAELRQGLGALNRPGFHHFARAWVGALPDRAAALDEGGVVLDAGCGTGWSTIALATAFPRARAVGLDLDRPSILEARAAAVAAGVADRVTFVVGDAGDPESVGDAVDAVGAVRGFDLVTVFEALHDMAGPAAALTAFRERLAPGGAVLVADERVAEEFGPDADPVERMLYAMSVLHCLPATLAESGPSANGTVLRAPTLRRWATEAGFDGADELPIEHPFWRFYRVA